MMKARNLFPLPLPAGALALAMAGTVKLVGAVLLATLIVATSIRAATAAELFKFDVAMKNCDDINKTKPGSCKKTSTKTKVMHGCFKSQNACFVCLNGKCYSATGETKVIRDNHGKAFVAGITGVPHHQPLLLRRDLPAVNGDLLDACSSGFPDCAVLEDDATVTELDFGASGPKIECVTDSRGRKGCHAGGGK
jgi:hypothetical protein